MTFRFYKDTRYSLIIPGNDSFWKDSKYILEEKKIGDDYHTRINYVATKSYDNRYHYLCRYKKWVRGRNEWTDHCITELPTRKDVLMAILIHGLTEI